MSESFIPITVKGSDHGQVSKELSEFFTSRFEQAPEITKIEPGKNRTGDRDFVGAAAFVVGIIGLMMNLPG